MIAHVNGSGEEKLRKLETRLLAAGVTVTRTAGDLARYHGKLMIVEPSTGEIRPGRKKDFPKAAPFDSEKAYRAAIKEAGGEAPASTRNR